MVRFLTVARVLFDKGYDELMSASAMLRDDGLEFEVQWLGAIDESYPQYVSRERIESDETDGLLCYLGVTEDVRPFVKGADCIVLASYHEGLSRTLIEALALSRPIIASDIPGCRETVVDGDNGFLCASRDANSLAECMRRFIALSDAERIRMGQRSRALALTRFDVRKVIEAYERLLR